MIGKYIEAFLYEDPSELMLEASSVATIRTENTLLHALMVLSSVGYSSIPVLDNKGHLKGILSLALIINGIKSTENYDWDQLAERQVHEIMETKPPRVLPSADLEDVLHLLVDHNYLCCVDTKGNFLGIITRKSMFKRINHLAHEFEIAHDVRPRLNTENEKAVEKSGTDEVRSAPVVFRSIW
ncbi:MAG: cyclic-di-AMP-binding protein CbpB [Saccharofermentanales bacterium]|jgi:predicted transcriptional regulator|nr:cyclic-di-AMP-binding protein CbpB [Bacillota bacterium]